MIPQPALNQEEILISTIRHGLTKLNQEKRVAGRIDAPLDKEGIVQAQIAYENFKGSSFNAVISSPLRRALETAFIVTGIDSSEIIIEPLCIERNFGNLEGLTSAEIKKNFPAIRYLEIGPFSYSLNPPQGETIEDVRQRANKFYAKIVRDMKGKRVIVLSHQIFLTLFHGILLGYDIYDSLKVDILHLELNQFHLKSDGQIIGHNKSLLYPDAVLNPSY